MIHITITPTFNCAQAATGTPFDASIHVQRVMEEEHGEEEPSSEDSPALPAVALLLVIALAARRRS